MTTLNLTRALENLVEDIVSCMDVFGHIDTTRIMFCVSSTRGGGVHGMYAKIHPLRFPGGVNSIEVKRGRRAMTCTMPSVMLRGREMLYLIYFLAPRYFDLPFREKLITVFHELYHISPVFDGDIRRFPGRNFAHGSSRKRYNAYMAELVDDYLGKTPHGDLTSFLEGDMSTLRLRYRAIVGRRHPAPKIDVKGVK
jgi:hypothetical protein